jgi:hypothetical protein
LGNNYEHSGRIPVILSEVEGSREVNLKVRIGIPRLAAASSECRLFGGRQRIDIHPSSRSVEAHIPIDQGKNSVVATKPDILARQKFRSALPDNDVAGDDQFASKFFNAQPLANAIAPVFYAALSLFMSHEEG